MARSRKTADQEVHRNNVSYNYYTQMNRYLPAELMSAGDLEGREEIAGLRTRSVVARDSELQRGHSERSDRESTIDNRHYDHMDNQPLYGRDISVLAKPYTDEVGQSASRLGRLSRGNRLLAPFDRDWPRHDYDFDYERQYQHQIAQEIEERQETEMINSRMAMIPPSLSELNDEDEGFEYPTEEELGAMDEGLTYPTEEELEQDGEEVCDEDNEGCNNILEDEALARQRFLLQQNFGSPFLQTDVTSEKIGDLYETDLLDRREQGNMRHKKSARSESATKETLTEEYYCHPRGPTSYHGGYAPDVSGSSARFALNSRDLDREMWRQEEAEENQLDLQETGGRKVSYHQFQPSFAL